MWPAALVASLGAGVDLVLAADCVYAEEAVRGWLGQLSSDDAGTIKPPPISGLIVLYFYPRIFICCYPFFWNPPPQCAPSSAVPSPRWWRLSGCCVKPRPRIWCSPTNTAPGIPPPLITLLRVRGTTFICVPTACLARFLMAPVGN